MHDTLSWKSLELWKLQEKKSFVNNRTIFFSTFEVTQWNGVMNKGFLKLYLLKVRSSCPEVFCRKGVLRNFENFTGKHVRQSPFLNKVASLSPNRRPEKYIWWLLLKSVKTVFVLFSFFIISNIMVKTFFQEKRWVI